MKKFYLLTVPALALVAFGATGCAKQQPPQTTPPPAIVQSSPPPAEPAPAAPVIADETEKPVEKSLQELQAELEAGGLLGDVFFDFDEADLRADARERLGKNAEFLLGRQELSFTLQGHCDERGTSEYNLALGLRRATVTADFLTAKGVGAERLKIVSFGEERPFCTLSNEECWQKNRRTHFLLTGRN